MEEYFLYLINNFSLTIFLISLAIFGITMVIKIPIKRMTSKLEESKRQGINTLIMLIPLVLAFIACLVYFTIEGRQILSLDYVSCSLSICIMSITIYLIYARIKIIIQGILSGKVKVKSDDVQEIVTEITDTLENKKEIANENKNTKEELNNILDKINALISFKQDLEKNGGIQTITVINETDNEIKLLQEQAELLVKKE